MQSPSTTSDGVRQQYRRCTHPLEEFKLIRISSNVPRETRFTNKLTQQQHRTTFNPLKKKLISKNYQYENHALYYSHCSGGEDEHFYPFDLFVQPMNLTAQTQAVSNCEKVFQMKKIEFAHYVSTRPSYYMMKNGDGLFTTHLQSILG